MISAPEYCHCGPNPFPALKSLDPEDVIPTFTIPSRFVCGFDDPGNEIPFGPSVTALTFYFYLLER